jgi:hypothetical protein
LATPSPTTSTINHPPGSSAPSVIEDRAVGKATLTLRAYPTKNPPDEAA